MPKPSRSECGRYLFVQITQGHWMRTHICVAQTYCPECGADVDKPCTNKHGTPVAGEHYKRRNAVEAMTRPRPHPDAVMAIAAVEPGISSIAAGLALRAVYGRSLSVQDAVHQVVVARKTLEEDRQDGRGGTAMKVNEANGCAIDATLLKEGIDLPPVWMCSSGFWASPLSPVGNPDPTDHQTYAGLCRLLAIWAGDDGKAEAYWGVQTTEDTFALWCARKHGGFPGGAEHIRTFTGKSFTAIVEYIGRDHVIRRALGFQVKSGTLATLEFIDDGISDSCWCMWVPSGEDLVELAWTEGGFSLIIGYPHFPALAGVTDPSDAQATICGVVRQYVGENSDDE